ncbi:MAG: tetraacyldisaccharide 4'-kinase [Crocinitomicaceae bacterium]|nr:tetraacyldisaccharide 4'-kinase [Crocinitomicaceae bacterium]
MMLRRILLFPFSIVYGGVTTIRNFMYNNGISRSYSIPNKSIVIGNLSMGGTGKSPHTLYLWDLLKSNHSVALLSRGYGRKTKGLLEVKLEHSSVDVGDEPLMFKHRVGNVSLVVVAEERKEGVKFIRNQSTQSVILLDDAFQHRKVKAGFSILLTEFNRPYFSDCIVPSGNLRECKIGRNRADCLIVTKCPADLTEQQKEGFKKQLKFKNNQVFFSEIVYDELVSFGKEHSSFSTVLLVTGIANPEPLKEYLSHQYKVESMVFPDHYHFTSKDIAKIHAKFDTFARQNTIIVTTEKDFVRLTSILTEEEKQNYPWYYQTITVKIDKKETFNERIKNYVDTI